MRLLILILPLMFVASVSASAQSQTKSPNPETSIDTKTRNELLEMENKLKQAIETHNVALLGSILADNYAGAYGEGERALSKRGALAECEAGTLSFYGAYMLQKISQRGDFVTIEGVSNNPKLVSDFEPPEEHLTHVRRRWTKKDGHWLLISQIYREIEEEKPRVKGK